MEGLDAWHKLLLGTIATLATVIGVMWKHGNTKDKKHATALAEANEKLEKQHEAHKLDVKALTQSALKLGLSVIARVRPAHGLTQLPTSSTEPAEDSER